MNEVLMPDRLTPVTGWRAWRIGPSDHLLSLNNEVVWPAGEPLRAHCNGTGPEMFRKFMRDHGVDVPDDYWPPSPVDGCSCGIYALIGFHPRHAHIFGQESKFPVIGKVALWGKVIVADLGYRAQYAYPQELYVVDEAFTHIAPGLEKYGVPVRKWSEQTVIPRLFLTDPMDLLRARLISAPITPPPPPPSPSRSVRALWFAVSLVMAGVFVVQGENTARILWWGASGASDLRVALGAVGAFAVGSFSLWYLNLARMLLRRARA